MGVPVMKEEELERIGLYVKNHIGAWLEEGNIIPFSRDIMLSERIVRVEEAIKYQGELIEKILNQNDKRFEQVDKRFEELRGDMNKRFSQLQWTMGLGFTILAVLMGVFNFY